MSNHVRKRVYQSIYSFHTFLTKSFAISFLFVLVYIVTSHQYHEECLNYMIDARVLLSRFFSLQLVTTFNLLVKFSSFDMLSVLNELLTTQYHNDILPTKSLPIINRDNNEEEFLIDQLIDRSEQSSCKIYGNGETSFKYRKSFFFVLLRK